MRLKASINLFVLLAVLLVGGAMLLAAFNRITVDMTPPSLFSPDEAAPHGTIPGMAQSLLRDQIVIDISSGTMHARRLVAVAETVVHRLNQSRLFQQVQNQPTQQSLSDLEQQVIKNLPILFTAGQLQRQVVPLLADEQIRHALSAARDDRYRSSDFGQAPGISADPLGLRHIVLARLSGPRLVSESAIQPGSIQASSRHLTLLVTPVDSVSDTTVRRFLKDQQNTVEQEFGARMTTWSADGLGADPDAASILNRNARQAIPWAAAATMVIVLLALLSPRLAGWLALLPAMAGTTVAFYVCALIHDSVSVMVLGFGSAIIFISVVHATAYLVLLDGSPDLDGRQVSREIRAVGLPTAISAIGAYMVLAFSGIAPIAQLGWFSALGTAVSVVFVYALLPRILPGNRDPAAIDGRRLARVTNRLFSTGKTGLVLGLLMAAALAVFIRPPSRIDLNASSTREMRTTNMWATAAWLVTDVSDLTTLQAKNDLLLEQLDTETHAGRIEKTVTPSLFFPGPTRRASNLEAWQAFWTNDRVQMVSKAVQREGTDLGLAHSAYDAFLKMIAAGLHEEAVIPPNVAPLLGIFRTTADGGWHQVTRITPRGYFDNQRFYDRLSDLCVVVDPALLAQHMRRALIDASIKLLIAAGGVLVCLLTVFLADAVLLLLTLLPLAVALVCTLGSLGIMGRPWDIPTIVLPVILMGMGAGYPLFLVRGYQRYLRFDHPQFVQVRRAVVLSAALTLVGMAALAGADDGFFNIVGWTSFLGIGYCLAGTLLILPALLKWRFEGAPPPTETIDRRYGNMAPYPRIWVRCRQRMDPILDELAARVPQKSDMVNILDVGCGYGLATSWFADHFPAATIHGIDPQAERVRVAALALGNQGSIVRGAAPDLPPMDVLLDLVTLLDVSHTLQEWELEKTLQRIHERLLPGGRLIMRSVFPQPARLRWTQRLAQTRLKISGIEPCYRNREAISAILDKCGFAIRSAQYAGKYGDKCWHVAKPI